ncbi:hypothetical protein pb186bvf_013213 [Paramecium bursaria]
MNSINETLEIKQARQQLKDVEQILLKQANTQNCYLFKQLQGKLTQLEKNIQVKVTTQYQNMLQPNPKVQKLPEVYLSQTKNFRKRAISTDVSNISFEKKNDTSFLIQKQMKTSNRQNIRYQILNDYENNLQNIKLDVQANRNTPHSTKQKRDIVKPVQHNIPVDIHKDEEIFVQKKRDRQKAQFNNQYKFIIKEGQRINCLELLNMKNHNQQDWIFINAIIKRLEKLNQQYKCNYFFVDGKSIIRLFQLKRIITLSDLLNCILNKEDIIQNFQHKLFIGYDSKDRAATHIQARIKGFLSRKKFARNMLCNNKIKIIQRQFRKFMKIREIRNQIKKQNNLYYEDFVKRQSDFQKDWDFIKLQQRVEIHIGSQEVSEYTRLSMDQFLQRENNQICRIFRASDQIQIIYITAFDISSEIENYYQRIFEMRGRKFNIKFIVPDNSSRLPGHMSILQKLLYSPMTIRKIRQLIFNKISYIMPGYPHSRYIKLCQSLNVPVYMGNPQLHYLYSSQSGAYSLLQRAELPVPVGASEIYDEQELINTLTVLIVKHQQIRIWVLKMDDSINGRGIATLSVEHIPGLRESLKQSNIEEIDEQSISIIKQLIKAHLPNKLKIAVRTLYRTSQEFIQAFLSVGGCIQGHPINDLKGSQILFHIEPNGEQTIISTLDCHSQFRNSIYTFPSLHNIDIEEQIQQLIRNIKVKQMFGYFTLELIVLDDGSIQATGLQCYINIQTSSYFYADFLGQINFMVCPIVCHVGLGKVMLKNFFHLCRMEQIEYHFETYQGQSFIFPDILQSQIIQMFSFDNEQLGCALLMEKSFEMIFKLCGFLNINYGKTLYESRYQYEFIKLETTISIYQMYQAL